MSVLIKGMKMPESCGCCPMCYCDHYGYVMCALINEEVNLKTKSPDCTLVEVKEPHGDLVDKDKLMKEFIDRDLDHLQRDDWKEVIQIVSDANVIIEAERSE